MCQELLLLDEVSILGAPAGGSGEEEEGDGDMDQQVSWWKGSSIDVFMLFLWHHQPLLNVTFYVFMYFSLSLCIADSPLMCPYLEQVMRLIKTSSEIFLRWPHTTQRS